MNRVRGTRGPRASAIGAVLDALPEAVALTLLAALPAFFNLASERIFEEEKSLVLRAGAALALLGVLLAWRAPRARQLREPIVIGFLAFTLMLLVAALAGVAPREAFMGAYIRRHGVLTLFALAVMLAAMCDSARSPAGRGRLLAAVAIGSIWPSAYLLLQGGGVDLVERWIVPTAGFQLGSTFGNHIFIGGYLATVMPLTAIHAWRSRGFVALLALQGAALVATGSRGAMVALGAGAVAFALIAAWTRISRRALAGAMLALGALAATMVVVPAARPASISRVFDPAVGSARVRVVTWEGIARLMRGGGRHLWIGYGPEGLRRVFPPFYSPEIGRLENSDALPDRAHNETLDTLVSAGIGGVVLQFAFFAAILAGALRVADTGMRAGLTAAAVAHIVEIQFGIATSVARLVFLCVGAVVVGSRLPGPGDAPAATARGDRGTRGRRGGHAEGAVVPRMTPWLVLSVAALVGALSPWASSLLTRGVWSAATGAEGDPLGSIRRLALATPLLYGALLAAALAVSRAIAAAGPRTPAVWWKGAAVAAGLVAAIPLSVIPSRADVASGAGAVFESRQQWPAAVAAYREASRMQPGESYYWTGLGRAQTQEALSMDPSIRVARLRAAREPFDRALALNPFDPDHPRHLAGLLRLQAWASDEHARAEPLAEADRLYAQATRFAPGLTSLWVEWAHVEVERARLPQAIEMLDRASRLDDTRVDAWLLRGQVHLMKRDARAALADYDAALSRQPDSSEALRGRGLALADLQGEGEARAR